MRASKTGVAARRLFVPLTAAVLLLGTTWLPALADRDVRVAAGDTLSAISLTYYGDTAHIEAIVEYNHLGNPNQIFAGQVLRLPGLDPLLPATAASPDPAVSLAASINTAADLIRLSAVAAPENPSPPPVSSAPASPLPALSAPPEPAPRPLAPPPQPPPPQPPAPRAGPVIQTGLATWYGPGFEGEITKCGQVFHQSQYTAASNDLPCGSVVQVTNVSNGRSVVVTITDTGAFHHPNILDLSRAAFSAIASTDAGVISVSVSAVGP